MFPNLSFMCAFLVAMGKVTPEEADKLSKELSALEVRADWRYILGGIEAVLKRKLK